MRFSGPNTRKIIYGGQSGDGAWVNLLWLFMDRISISRPLLGSFFRLELLLKCSKASLPGRSGLGFVGFVGVHSGEL